jgi:N-acetylglucosaminyldiphosphoundecaprenol N-acetyl-beta-D-mannosaminyltransferase
MTGANGSSARRIPRVDVLGVQVSATSLPRAAQEIAGWVHDERREYVCVTGVHGVMECQGDPELLGIHNASGLTTTDGMPLVWASRRAGVEDVTRVYGPDLMLEVCQHAAAEGWSSFFYGAAEGVPELLAENLSARFPGLEVVGTYSPPYRELTADEAGEVAAMINDSGADLVWIGLSTPKQERWMAEFRSRLDAPVLLGVGAAFDIHAGLLRQAPPLLQRAGLEWAYRLGVEPRRLWRRYLKNNPIFVANIIRHPPRIVPAQAPA